MKPNILKQVLLYKYRYQSSIIVFLVLLAGLLMLRLDIAPTGLSEAEMSTAVSSATFQPSFPIVDSLVDLPYKLLQKASLSILGITEIGILLPSLILGAASGVAFLLMVRRWFRMNIALITSFIFVTSAAFLTLARTGTPLIMTTFWLSIILLAVTNILHPEGKSRLWAVVLLIALPLSLYTPLMMYPLIAIAVAGLLHPHVRFLAKRLARWKYIAAGVLVATLLLPLIIWLIQKPTSLGILTGVPSDMPTLTTLWINIKYIVKTFFSVGTSTIGAVPQPIFGAASLIIITLGFFKTIADHHSARSYMLLIWTGLFIPIAIMNPDKVLICLVPAYLFMAVGVETLLREWYKLFPLNPYARLIGFVPLVILLGGIMASNTAQYFYGHFYGTPTVSYRRQLETTRTLLADTKPDTKVTVVTTSSEMPFYDLLRRDYDNVLVTNAAPSKPPGVTLIHDGASYASEVFGMPSQIVTSYTADQKAVIARIFR